MKGRTKKVVKKNKRVRKLDPRIKKVGARLKAIRQKAGHPSAEKFAFTHEISRAQYSLYEQGSDMWLSTFLRVLDAHGITLKEFFSEGFE